MKPERLIVVSNRLPVRVQRGEAGFVYTPSVGGLATTLNALREDLEMIWLGAPGIATRDPQEFRAIREHLAREFGSVPVALEPSQFKRYYDGFSNGCLWPLFHYFPQFAHYDHEEWAAYREVNRQFRDALLEVLREGDSIWVHDYHLMLLPAMIREAVPDAIIGFFLHIPFPSYESPEKSLIEIRGIHALGVG